MYYLYLKTHEKTNLKYLGFTAKNPFKYKGSGLYWLRHIKKHGYEKIKTEILFQTTDKKQITEKGKYYSILWDIVNSKQFANLTFEEGTGGAINTGKKHSKESIQKMSNAKKGKKFTEQHKKNLSNSQKGKIGEKNSFYGKCHSSQSKSKMSQSLKGKIRSPEFKENLSKMYKGKIKTLVTCPHCNKTGGKPVMIKYHFDKCKHRIMPE